MVIARFSWIKAGFVLTIVGAMLVAGAWIVHLDGLRHPVGWIFVLAGPILLLYFVAILSQLLFHQGRAIWLENGQLIFVPFGFPTTFTSFLYRVPVDDIKSVTIERLYTGSYFIRPRGIIVDRKSRGFGRPFGDAPAHLYSEPVEVVQARLCRVLGIKSVPVAVPVEVPAVIDSRSKEWRP